MAHYHFLGIAGAFMAGAARLAAELGHQISGSDRAFYPPFVEEAHRTGATLHTDYQTTAHDRPTKSNLPPSTSPPHPNPPMAHYHFLGIAGAFMAGAARLAAELGHQISGSDRAFYPPFSEEARRP